MPAPEEYEEALLVVEENAEKAPLTEAQQNTFNMLIERGAVHHPEDDLPNVVWFGNRCLYIEEDGGFVEL